jgi:hypothetical protein
MRKIMDSLKSPCHRISKLSKRACEEHVAVYSHTLASTLSCLLAHSAALVVLANRHSGDIDCVQLQASCTALEVCLGGAVEASRCLAALAVEEGGGGKILQEAQSLTSALIKLLTACQPQVPHPSQHGRKPRKVGVKVFG